MRYYKKAYRCLTILLAVIFAVQLLMPVSAAEGDTAAPGVSDGVNNVSLNGKGTKISVSVLLSDTFIKNNPKADVYLFELAPGMGVSSLNSLEPVTSFRVTAKYTYRTPLATGSLTRLYCSYQLAGSDGAGGYLPIGPQVYITNPETLAERDFAYPDAISPKGLEVLSVADALSLGAAHAVIGVPAEDMFAESPGAGVTDFDRNGVTYHFNSAALASLDDKVKALSDEGVRVYLRFTLDTLPSQLPASLACLGYADAQPSGHYALNASDRKCAAMLAALFELLADRYTSPDRAHGFCGSFILGSAVNLPSRGNAASPSLTPATYTDAYSRLVRLAYTAMISTYSGGRVFISLAENYNALPASPLPADNSVSSFLANFSTITSNSGDFDWSVAVSAYPYDRSDSSIWDDQLATGASSQYLSPANINVLTYALSKSYTFAGSPRRLIVDSFAVSDIGSATEQAASYAFAYYKIVEDGSVDALIYSEQLDIPGANAGLGLSTADVSGNILTRKAIWNVFRTIDTDDDSAVASLGGTAGGVFEYMYAMLRTSVAVRSRITGEAKADPPTDKLSISPLFDFTEGERHDFALSGHGYPALPPLVSAGGAPALLLSPGVERCVVRNGIERSLLSGAELIIIRLADCPADGTLTLRLSQNGSPVYESSAAFAAGCGSVSFDVSGFVDKLERGTVNMTLRLSSGGSVAVSAVSTASSGALPSVLWIILLILLVLFALMMIIALFSRAYHRSRRKRSTAVARREE